jgi:hypothetical protein
VVQRRGQALAHGLAVEPVDAAFAVALAFGQGVLTKNPELMVGGGLFHAEDRSDLADRKRPVQRTAEDLNAARR